MRYVTFVLWRYFDHNNSIVLLVVWMYIAFERVISKAKENAKLEGREA